MGIAVYCLVPSVMLWHKGVLLIVDSPGLMVCFSCLQNSELSYKRIGFDKPVWLTMELGKSVKQCHWVSIGHDSLLPVSNGTRPGALK